MEEKVMCENCEQAVHIKDAKATADEALALIYLCKECWDDAVDELKKKDQIQ